MPMQKCNLEVAFCQAGVTSSGSVSRKIPRRLLHLTSVILHSNHHTRKRTAVSSHVLHSEQSIHTES